MLCSSSLFILASVPIETNTAHAPLTAPDSGKNRAHESLALSHEPTQVPPTAAKLIMSAGQSRPIHYMYRATYGMYCVTYTR